MSPANLMNRLTWCELNKKYAPDCRRVIRGERIALQAALRSGKATEIAKAKAEALRVCEMWGVEP